MARMICARRGHPTTTPALDDLAGEPFAGRWTLQISDNVRQDTGRLDGWGVEVDPATVSAAIEVAADTPARGSDPGADAAGFRSTLTVVETTVVARLQVTVDIR